MEPNEIDIALEELEQRLERLRSLYEQYFLGIEKVEPTIARKDVDRRFWILRRTKLRNTARRFRMQLLVQRYNTFQQYWMRICRQIEAGTYIRHVLRAEKKFGSEAVTIKARRREAAMAKARELAGEARKPSQSEMEAAGDSMPPPSGADALGSDPPSSDGLSAKPTLTIAAVRIPAARPADEATPVEPRPRPKRIPREDPDDAEIEIHDTPVPPAVSFYSKPTTKLPAITAAGRGENIGKHLPPAPASTRFTERPAVSMTPAPGSTTRFSIPAARRPARSPSDTATTMPQLRATPATAAESAAALSAKRVQELHAQLSAEKKRLADDSPVSLDGLAKSLNETAAKLKSMHGSGKQVDFRVVVKGGKAMVKPVLK
ncbi:MAG TPA: MXAN_5187 C-terminal domain-containing protein [Polyangiaceae bacterium]|nr:MXAN_5187 C-terminal domain-containing protein [Polyangiaceae bacterium]